MRLALLMPCASMASVSVRIGACDPRDFGAKADGKNLDSPAINAAIQQCDHVVLAGGTFRAGSVHLKSNLILEVAADAVLKASGSKEDFDAAEANEWDQYQDFGHSHFHNSFIWGEGLSNVTLHGAGLIDGGGHLTHSSSDVDQPNKLLALKSCRDVRIQGLSMRRSGWFALLANDIDVLYIQGVQVAAERDGLDIISSRHVRVLDVNIQGGGDDAVVFKGDYALGRAIDSYDLLVANSILGCGCNPLQFGSETVGNFRDVLWENITVTEAGKAGIGIVSMDGSKISNVTYRNISMSRVTTPVYMYIGARSRRPEPGPIIGSISDVLLQDVVATDIQGKRGNWTATLDGQNRNESSGVKETHVIGPNIRIVNTHFSYKGRGSASLVDRDPPHPTDAYPPRILGDRPSYGWYLRNVKGVRIENSVVNWEEEDERPSVMVDGECEDVAFSELRPAHGDDSVGFDIGVRGACGTISLSGSPGVVQKRLGDFMGLSV